MAKHYTKQEEDKIISLRRAGNSVNEIAVIMEVTDLAISKKISKLRKAGRFPASIVPSVVAKRKYNKKPKALQEMHVHTTPATKPMIVLVGSPAEVTQTIRELFS